MRTWHLRIVGIVLMILAGLSAFCVPIFHLKADTAMGIAMTSMTIGISLLVMPYRVGNQKNRLRPIKYILGIFFLGFALGICPVLLVNPWLAVAIGNIGLWLIFSTSLLTIGGGKNEKE